MPEVVLVPQEKKLELLQNYFQTVVRREIIDRFKIKNEMALKALLQLLLNSTTITITKLYRTLKSLGFAIGKTTLSEYLEYIKTAYFMNELYLFTPSVKDKLQYPRKIYFIDNGFITSLSTKFSRHYGRLFENLIYWHLKKQGKEIYYYHDRYQREADFVILDNQKVKAIYQASYDLSDIETREREVNSLLLAGKKLKSSDLRIVGFPEEKNLHKKVRQILPYDFFN